MTKIFLLALLLVCAGCAPSERPCDDLSGLHPKMFAMMQCWLSDTREPVVTEINLDAITADTNQFSPHLTTNDDGCVVCDDEQGGGFIGYRILRSHGNNYTVRCFMNTGGTLTTQCTVEFTLLRRTISINGTAQRIRVLRVISFERLSLATGT